MSDQPTDFKPVNLEPSPVLDISNEQAVETGNEQAVEADIEQNNELMEPSPPSETRSGWTKLISSAPRPVESPTTEEPTAEQIIIKIPEKIAEEAADNPIVVLEDNLFETPEDRRRLFKYGHMTTDDEFKRILKSVYAAIQKDINPQRIKQGSSGSYFVLNERGEKIAVFKPKTEEPYGHLNPKVMKYLHRTCCPCFFGRSCIIPNTGFLSEAAASVVDRQLRLNVVPRTNVVRLAAPTFHYGYWARVRAQSKNGRLPEKLGSFQMFVSEFLEATVAVPMLEGAFERLAPELQDSFQREFERLVILDYIIRNTDRSMDNWMIHVSWEVIDPNLEPSSEEQHDEHPDQVLERSTKTPEAFCLFPESTKNRRPVVKIAAIDNGLAFPFKHPNNLRSYPYSWAACKWASKPFSDQTCAEFIPILEETSSWDSIIEHLRLLFRADESEFDYRVFERQMAILRGQLFNLLEALKKKESPLRLIRKPLLLIEEEITFFGPDGGHISTDENLPKSRSYKKKEVKEQPWFSFC